MKCIKNIKNVFNNWLYDFFHLISFYLCGIAIETLYILSYYVMVNFYRFTAPLLICIHAIFIFLFKYNVSYCDE